MTTVVRRDARTGRNLGHDLTGHRTGCLTVLEPTDGVDDFGYRIWRARCECGAIIERGSYRFVRGMKSCGCGPKGRPRIADHGAHVNALFGHYRTSARSRGLAFTLTRDELRRLLGQDCAYCGAPPDERPTHRNLSGSFQWNGIDRVDNTQGYTNGNCVSCCKQCNFAKRDLSRADFFAWIQRAHQHLFRA